MYVHMRITNDAFWSPCVYQFISIACHALEAEVLSASLWDPSTLDTLSTFRPLVTSVMCSQR